MKTRKPLVSLFIGAALLLVSWCSPSAFAANLTGQWDFNSGLTATVGTDLQYADGVGGATAAATVFGKASSFGIPGIVPTDAAGNPTGAGLDADIMRFPKMGSASMGYQMWHGAAANGTFSAGDVNQWSLVLDIYYPAASTDKYRALFQTSASNGNDADLFIGSDGVSPNPNGFGTLGQYHGTIVPDNWYRLAFIVNLDAPTGDPTILKYINGTLVGTQTDKTTAHAPWSAASGNPSWLFSDNDGETELGYVDHVRFYDGPLTGAEVALLGGIRNVPEPSALALLVLGATAALIRRRIQ